MEEKKNFFASLKPESALIVGAVTGFLVLCMIGFFVLGGLALNGKLNLGGQTTTQAPAVVAQPQDYGTQAVAPAPVVVAKADKPKVELFVMSYCPYGLQMEKAYLPAWELLKDKADIDVKFVSYAMHGLKEVEENTRQYCIQGEQNDRYMAYLQCFAAKGDAQSCIASTGINESKLNSCVTATNKKFAIMDKYNDQTTWLSGQYPLYPIHDTENNKYGVQGSPTLVINGSEVQIASRTPEALKQAICASFNNAPAECQQTLSNTGYQPGFGFTAAVNTTGAAAAAPGCGT